MLHDHILYYVQVFDHYLNQQNVLVGLMARKKKNKDKSHHLKDGNQHTTSNPRDDLGSFCVPVGKIPA